MGLAGLDIVVTITCPSDQSLRVLTVALCMLAFPYGPYILWSSLIATIGPMLDPTQVDIKPLHTEDQDSLFRINIFIYCPHRAT